MNIACAEAAARAYKHADSLRMLLAWSEVSASCLTGVDKVMNITCAEAAARACKQADSLRMSHALSEASSFK